LFHSALQFSSKVVMCTEAQITTVTNGKKENVSGYEVILEDTILFPEGGGQPCDHGLLDDTSVLQVVRRGAEAVHFVKSVLPVGKVVKQTLDWERRLDHMQQHSGQHLITALADINYGYSTTSWWLGEEESYIELGTPSMKPEEMDELEKLVNEKIREATPVNVTVYQEGDDELKKKLLSSSLLSKNLKVRIYKTVILPVVLYGCKTWTLTLREEHRLKVFENKVLRKIFGAKRDEVTGEWRKLHNTELHALYSSPDIIKNIKSRRLRWAGHVARMGEYRNAYSVLVGRQEGKRPLGRPRRRWEEMDLREVGFDEREWINLAQDRDQWRAYVRAAMNLRVRTRGLPDDHKGPVRVVTIQGVESNMCCGTHVSNLSQLQAIKLLRVEKGKKNKTNLFFVAGGRVMKQLGVCLQREQRLTTLLKNSPADHFDLVDKLQKSLKLANKNLQTVLRDLAVYEAEKIRKMEPLPTYYSLHRKEAESDFMSILINEVADQPGSEVIRVHVFNKNRTANLLEEAQRKLAHLTMHRERYSVLVSSCLLQSCYEST
ncbi:hypothetical protein ANN_00257, partial [Periplaneta americana]